MPGKPRTVFSMMLRFRIEMTLKSMVETLDRHSDLILTTPEEYDLRDGTIAAYRYRDGVAVPAGRVVPDADLWIQGSDCFSLDHRLLGFERRMELYHAIHDFLDGLVAVGRVSRVINSPEAERNTLKDFLADLDPECDRVIPSFRFGGFGELVDLYRTHGDLVVKPVWGGLGKGIVKVTSEKELMALQDQVLDHHVAQVFYRGPEKRLWILGGKVVDGGIRHGRDTPWSSREPYFQALRYWEEGDPAFMAEIEAAHRICEKSGLTYGSVDFIGDRINEINGSGTGFTMNNLAGEIVVDRCDLLEQWLVGLLEVGA